MNEPNKEGECATYGFAMGKIDVRVETVLAGCYWAFAYVDKPSTASNPQNLCVTDETQVAVIWISSEVINFH